MKKAMVISALMSAAALSIASPAAAQSHHPETAKGEQMQSEGMMDGQMKSGMLMHQGMMECPMMGQSRGGPRTEGRLAFLKAELKIKSGQESAWNTYADAVRDSHKHKAGHMAKMHQKLMKKDEAAQTAERTPAPEALRKRIEMMEAMLANLKSVSGATSTLYDKLDQLQKATADELLGMSCGMTRM